MPRSWFWFQLVFARHSSELQHNLRYDVFIKISLHSAGFNLSMATSQLHLQAPTVSVTPDFIDNYNDYISYTVITTVKILSQRLRNCMVQGLNKICTQGRVCGWKSGLLTLQMLALIISVKTVSCSVFLSGILSVESFKDDKSLAEDRDGDSEITERYWECGKGRQSEREWAVPFCLSEHM